MKICIFGTCPVCQTGDDLAAIIENRNKTIGYYHYGCGCVWTELPADLDKYILLKRFAPDGAKILSFAAAKQLCKDAFEVLESHMSEKDFFEFYPEPEIKLN